MNRLVDFVVMGMTFYLSCLVLAIELGSGLYIQILIYATIMLVFVQIFKGAVVIYKSSVSENSRQILGNAAGILIGTLIMLFLESLSSNNEELTVVTILSSVMAFFILGTLSPIVQKNPIGHKETSNF
jgi:hypothetical protein